MSQRGKRPNRSEDGPIPVKRRKVIAVFHYCAEKKNMVSGRPGHLIACFWIFNNEEAKVTHWN